MNNRDKNFTKAEVQRWRAQLEESVARYLSQLDTADRQEPSEALAAKATRLKEKLTKLKEEMGKLAVYEKQMRGHGAKSRICETRGHHAGGIIRKRPEPKLAAPG